MQCPYAQCELTRPCNVKSCNFQIEGAITSIYKNCYLYYLNSIKNYDKLPLKYREKIVQCFLGSEEIDTQQASANFYLGLINLLLQDTIIDLPRSQLEPIPYKQCCVCGSCEKELWFPKAGVLPYGYGYCSYACFQLKPPPILIHEQFLESEYKSLMPNLKYDIFKTRAKFVQNLIQYIFSNISNK